MRLYHIIVFFYFIFSSKSYSQQKKELYILIEDSITQMPNTEFSHELVYNVKSNDPRFQRDSYYFSIPFDGFQAKKLEEEGKAINLKEIDYQKSSVFFNNKPACEIHEELSLNQVFLIKEFKKSNINSESKFIIWQVIYSGTVKNTVYTELRLKNKN